MDTNIRPIFKKLEDKCKHAVCVPWIANGIHCRKCLECGEVV